MLTKIVSATEVVGTSRNIDYWEVGHKLPQNSSRLFGAIISVKTTFEPFVNLEGFR